MWYIGFIHKERGSDYGVSFPDFPGCITAGKTVEEAHEMAREALQLHIEGMIEDGEALPAPAVYNDAARHEFAKGAVMNFMVEAIPPRPVKQRVNVMMEEALIEAIDKVSSNRSEFLSEAARMKLGSPHKAA